MLFQRIEQAGAPQIDADLQHNLRDGGGEAGAGGVKNIVAEVTLKYRSFDALGEVAAFFTAVIGVLAIAREVGRKR